MEPTLTETKMIPSVNKDAKKDTWKLPSSVKITFNGRNIVGGDPDVSDLTVQKLFVSEASLITDELKDKMFGRSAEQILDEEFFEGNTGIAHLSQCIKEDLKQTKADLIAKYSLDRRIPFVTAAFYINVYMQHCTLFYYLSGKGDEYYIFPWSPHRAYIAPKSVLPIRNREFKSYTAFDNCKPGALRNCPECGSPAKLFRTGYRGSKMHVCCTNAAGDCIWYLGTNPMDSATAAIEEWNSICQKAQK